MPVHIFPATILFRVGKSFLLQQQDTLSEMTREDVLW